MFKKNLPSCACMSVVTKVAVPTTLGIIVSTALKIPDIIKAANAVKDAIPAIQKMASDLDKQLEKNSTKEESEMG